MESLNITKKYKQHKNFNNYVNGFKPYYEDILKVLPKSKTSLDLGCAYGVLALELMLRGDKTYASDMTDKYTNVKMLKENGIEFIKNNIEKSPLPVKVDLITCTETLEHLNSNPLPAVKRMYDALNEGGNLFISTVKKELYGKTTSMNKGEKGLWNDLDSWKDIPEYKGKRRDEHTFHYDQWNLITLLSEAGFEVEEVGDIGGFSNYIIGKRC
jgi:2-polyprenyl-3-methyl-5-hydroxy-6-metoxy-1,4-benzoquinol methylase